MTNDKSEEIIDKIIAGLELSAKRLLAEKKKVNGKLVVYQDGKVQVLNARDIVSPK